MNYSGTVYLDVVELFDEVIHNLIDEMEWKSR